MTKTHAFLHTQQNLTRYLGALTEAGFDVSTPKPSARMARVDPKPDFMDGNILILLTLLTYVITPEELHEHAADLKFTERKAIALDTLLTTNSIVEAGRAIKKHYDLKTGYTYNLAHHALFGPSRFALMPMIQSKYIHLKPTIDQYGDVSISLHLECEMAKKVLVKPTPNIRGVAYLDNHYKHHLYLWQQTPTGWELIDQPTKHREVKQWLTTVKLFAALNPPQRDVGESQGERLFKKIEHYTYSVIA